MADRKDENLEENQEEDKVAAAYENISKKLESIRNGKDVNDSNESEESDESKGGKEEELEEWKGPKPPARDEKESDDSEDDDMELRKVKLRNLEEVKEPKDADVSDESKELEDDEDEDVEKVSKAGNVSNEDDEDEKEDKEVKKDWEPKAGDPLDEEDSVEESKASEGSKDSEEEDQDELKEPDEAEELDESKDTDGDVEENDRPRIADFAPETDSAESESNIEAPKKDPQPDSLDDLTEDEYDIPHLKASRQGGGNLGYNAPSETETFDRGYQPRSDSIGSRLDRGQDKSSMETNDPNNFFSAHNQPQAPKRANKFHLLVLVIIGIAVIGFTVYILKGGFGQIGIGTTSPSPSPSVEATPTPTPTPTPEPDRAQFKVRVLNGSGKTGLAKTVADKLKELGYQVDKTGNATNSAFTQTIIRVKSANESFIPQLVKDLTPDFDAAGNTSLKDDDSVDIEIILGAK